MCSKYSKKKKPLVLKVNCKTIENQIGKKTFRDTYFLVMSFLPLTKVVDVDVRFMLLLPGALLNDMDEMDENPLDDCD